MFSSVESITNASLWDIVERTGWVVGILAALVPATIAVVNAIRGKSAATSAEGPETNVVKDSSFGKKARITQTSHVTTNNLIFQPIHIEQPASHTGSTKKTNDEPDNTWLQIALLVAVAVAAFFLYVNYRPWALGFTAGTVAVTIGTTFLTSLLVRTIGDKWINVALLCNTLAVILAGGLLWRLSTRSSPYGDYSDLREYTRGEGWVVQLIVDKGGLLMFVVLEILALIYVLVVMLMIVKHQLGIVTAINLALNELRATNGLTRWLVRTLTPRSRWQLVGIPILLSVFIGIAWLFSSVWFFDVIQGWRFVPPLDAAG